MQVEQTRENRRGAGISWEWATTRVAPTFASQKGMGGSVGRRVLFGLCHDYVFEHRRVDSADGCC